MLHTKQPTPGRDTIAVAFLFACCSRQQQDSRQQEPVLQWRSFALRQVQRYVPALPDPSRRAVHESVCYRLRVLHVDNLPPLSYGVQYGLQLGVTLFDASLGQPYGSTCCSVVKDLQQQADDGASQQHTVAFDVLFHTVICDPRCVAVVSQRCCGRLSCAGNFTAAALSQVELLNRVTHLRLS